MFFKNQESNVALSIIEPFILNLVSQNVPKKITSLYEKVAKFTQPLIDSLTKLKEKIDETISNDAIGIIKRKIDPDYNIKNFMPAVRPYELKTNTFPMQNFVCAKNFNVITKGLNEYEIFKKELKICLLRGFSTISNPKNKTRAIPAGPDLKTETSQSLGLNERDLIISFGNYEKSFNLIDVLYEN